MSKFIEINNRNDDLLLLNVDNIISVADKVDHSLITIETKEGVQRIETLVSYNSIRDDLLG